MSSAWERWRSALRRRPWSTGAAVVAGLTLVAMVAVVVAPWFADPTTYGFHDWDVVSSYRYLVARSLLEHHEFPGWNPYACGGYPAWGYVEGATNLVSPWLPAYLLLPLPLALRAEVVGMALVGAFGAYALGAAVTRSHGARLLVAALWAVNGRWGLQTASGHTWHLAYAYLPWCLLFFERARSRRGRLRHVVLLGALLAMLVYSGGVYPLPHTVLALGAYAVLCAAQERRLRPLVVLAAGGLIGLGLAAPKLLPIADAFGRDPRFIASTERLDLGAFVTLLTDPNQPFHARPARVSPYGWHEWGMYISASGLGLLAAGVLFVEGRRERAFKAVGLTLALLGFGAFHPSAPWTLLHAHAPVFQSQHVPSRFLYPAVLLLALVTASGLGRFVDRRSRRAPWLDLALALGVSVLALDVARVAAQPMAQAMWLRAPEVRRQPDFHFSENPPFQYQQRDWAGPMLLSMMANTGVLNCYGVPRSEGWKWHARAATSAGYRGEVYLEGAGRAQLVSWSPNRVRVALSELGAGAVVVYNMHHHPGWHAELVDQTGVRREPEVEAREGLIAVAAGAASRELVLWYRPPGLGAGLGCAAATVALLCVIARRRRDDGEPEEECDA